MTTPSADRFKQSVVITLAKRAANRCSNPDCGTTTSGPSDDRSGSVNVGEAAHIYGAHPGSARYDPVMASADRSAITNAIWLCGNCHKLIDDDPNRYPAGLLFEWNREHEQMISSEVGKAGASARRRYEQRHLEEFGKLSYLAERLITEKDKYWEYKLTGEVLRFEMTPILRRWAALQRGLYIKKNQAVSAEEFSAWMQNVLAEWGQIIHAFNELTNIDFVRSWGEPGVAGNDMDIVETCRLYIEMCQSALEWEEKIRFTKVDSRLDPVRALFAGVAGYLIDQAAKVPAYIASVFNDTPTPGKKYMLEMVLTLPDGWAEAVEAAFEQAAAELARDAS